MSVWRARFRPTLRSDWVCERCVAEPAGRSSLTGQRRWITQNHIRNIMNAEEEWQLRRKDIEVGKRKSMLDLLEERGFVNQIVGTRDELNELLNARRVGVYAGVDPTAPSMHVGHMVPYMALGWMYIHGYSAHYLLGGFTAGIGDPIGRLTGRKAQTNVERTANLNAMHQQLVKLGKSIEQQAGRKGYQREWAWRRALVNNHVWWQRLTMKEFMRVMGAGMRIGPMLGRDTVKNRLDSGEGMSFSEFTYPLVQAWDWWHLFQQGVQLQIGGADQFGNLLAGAEAVKYMMTNDKAYIADKESTKTMNPKRGSDAPMGFTVPLLTTSTGEKFGKSAGNAVWLEPSMTSSFDLYQFFLRSADADVERYLKLFTFLPLPEIAEIMTRQNEDPSKRIAQHKLAQEFVELVHGVQAAQEASNQHKAMFSKNMTVSGLYEKLNTTSTSTTTSPSDSRPADLHPSLNKHAAPQDMHTGGAALIKLPRSLVIGKPLSRILWSAGLVASRSEGQRLINARGAYIGGRHHPGPDQPAGTGSDTVDFSPVDDPSWAAVSRHVLDEKLLMLRTGKWRMKIVEVVDDDEFARLGLDCPGWREDVEAAADAEPEAVVDGQVAWKPGHSEAWRDKAEERQKRRRRDERGAGHR